MSSKHPWFIAFAILCVVIDLTVLGGYIALIFLGVRWLWFNT